MKKFNFLENLLRREFAMSGMRGLRGMNGLRTETLNPDSQPTVNRQSRLTSLQRHDSVTNTRVAREWLKYAAMFVMLLTIGVGNAWGADVTWNLTTNSWSSISNDQVVWSSSYVTATATKGSGTKVNNYCPTTYSQHRLYNGNTLTISPVSGYSISSITITATGASYRITGTWTNGTASAPSGKTYTTITPTTGTSNVSCAISATCRLTEIKVTYTTSGGGSTCETPTFSPGAGSFCGATDVSISCGTAGATIRYTTNGDTPTESSSAYSSAIHLTAASTTIKAKAFKDGLTASSVASATYTNSALTTMDAIYTAATAAGGSATSVCITFNNWVVSGASSNGRNVYVTDGTKGFLIYGGSDTGFRQGDILSGSVSCSIQMYNNAAELTSLTTSTTGLTVTKGGSVSPTTLDESGISALTGVNTGRVITTTGVCGSCNSTKQCINGAQLYDQLYSYTTPTNGTTYTVTGVYLRYGSTQEILPLSDLTTYTITAVSNNNSYGTVSVSNGVITATPASGYRVIAGNGGYTVTSGTATVVNNGDNTLTVTPSSNCTVRVNFEQIPTHTLTFSINGGSCGTSSVSVAEGASYSLPSVTGLTSSCEYGTFVGWTTESSTYVHGTSPLYTTSITMSTSNIELHAVYSKTTGGGSGFTLSLDASGTEYYIAPRSGSNNYMGATTTAGEAETFYIETDNEDNNYLYIYESATKTYINIDDNNTSLDIRTDSPTAWTIAESSNLWTFTTTATGGRNLAYNYNNGSPRFASYTGSDTYLYQFTKHSSGTTTYSLSANCCDENVTLSNPTITDASSSGSTITFDKTSPVATCDGSKTVTATVTLTGGYQLTALSFSGGSVSVSPTISTPITSSTSYTLTFAQHTNATLTTTATVSAKPLNTISLAEDAISVYVGEIKYVNVVFDPTDILSKAWSQAATPSYCQLNSYDSYNKLKITGGRAGADVSVDRTETASIKYDADNTKTASISVTVKPLPTVTFVDLIHNKTDFANAGDGWTAGTGVLSSTATSGTVSHAKKTPTHTDVSEPGTGNTCEKGHLHLAGWIRSDYSKVAAYMDGTGDVPTKDDLTGAGEGYWFNPGADINVETYNGKTFYAVWAGE